MTTIAKPELRVTVFSDYICPFCYIGDARLNRLREDYQLKVNWCFLEIHPETPAEGQSVAALGYEPESWRRMMDTLRAMAEEDGLALREHDFTTNSRSALLLAEAAKHHDPTLFHRVHDALFERYFVHGDNIGDRDVLRRIAQDCGLPATLVERAWTDTAYSDWLRQYAAAARELGVRATPTFFIGRQRIDGAQPVASLRAAARDAA